METLFVSVSLFMSGVMVGAVSGAMIVYVWGKIQETEKSMQERRERYFPKKQTAEPRPEPPKPDRSLLK